MTINAGTQLGRYEILSQIGAGGMGEVYLAEDTRLHRKVALKTLPAELTQNEDRLRRFEQEAQAAAALNHPNIAHIYEIGEADGLHFIAMEYVEGATLREKIHREKTELRKLLRYLQQVAEGLAKAHAAGIVHRDLKPDNVMITRDGYAKILDFGLAKLTEQTKPPGGEGLAEDAPTAVLRQPLSTPGLILGTVGYMSPEQTQAKAVDHRSDIFSFGCILFEAATGQRAFESESTIDTLHKVVHTPAPLVKDTNPSAPMDLTRIVRRCLAKDPDERYQSIKEAAIELRELRRELEGVEELETTMPPSSGGSTISSAKGSAATESGADRSTASSAEYIITGIMHHRLAAIGVLGALVLGAVGFAAYLNARNTEAAIESIAVLPFVNQNHDPNTEYLSDGITESIINSLSQLPNLKVMSRNSVFHYKGKDMDPQAVAKELKVRAVLMGSVAQRGDGLSISVELINGQDNSQIWGHGYNRKLADVFAVQEEMAKEISEKLRLKLTGAERQQLAKRPTENVQAFQYYMQGRVFTQRRTREDLLTAVHLYERAIEEDRNYALAHAGLADAYSNLGLRSYIAPNEGRRKAEEAARKALALDENLAEAHAALGYAYTVLGPYNFSLGDRELRRAIELSPSFALAHFYLGNSLLRQGLLDEGLEEYSKARELDPLSPIIARAAATPYYLKRNFVRALELLRQANDLGPPFSITWEIGAYIQNGLFIEALAELEKAKRERKNDPILIYSTGMVYAAQGKRAEALPFIKELENMSGASLSQAHWIAKIYATLNDKELALDWLNRGLEAGEIGVFYKDEVVWDSIRNDPR
ncbi:MAG TPA: protein kinase, partial [Blastocatellia bacterium]|nr:protein kinase [Blastocatellia bacterium]